MKTKWIIFVGVGVILFWIIAPRHFIQPFDRQKWNESRRKDPNLNACPWMVEDLMANHLPVGMSLSDVTNMLGYPEVETSSAVGLWKHGEFLEQTVYVYHPGMHNGWMVTGTNSLNLYFGRDGEGLKEWTPLSIAVGPRGKASEQTEVAPSGRLPLGNLKVAGTTSQFDRLLGPPDEQRLEYQLNYFLGKRTRFAWDETFLELHFDEKQTLVRMDSLEH